MVSSLVDRIESYSKMELFWIIKDKLPTLGINRFHTKSSIPKLVFPGNFKYYHSNSTRPSFKPAAPGSTADTWRVRLSQG